jgi:argininosuccinate lyase
VPFRDAHEQVASAVREGSFAPPEHVTDRYLQRRGIDVAAAVAAAKERWS